MWEAWDVSMLNNPIGDRVERETANLQKGCI